MDENVRVETNRGKRQKEKGEMEPEEKRSQNGMEVKKEKG